MGPCGVLRDEISEENLAAEVVDGGDQRPFLFGEGGPKMHRRAVLDEGSDRGHQDFAVVGLSLPTGFVAVQALGSVDDRVGRYLNVLLQEAITQR